MWVPNGKGGSILCCLNLAAFVSREMSKLMIQGEKKLSGKVRIAGAKNSAVALIPAVLLAGSECTLQNVPDLSDVAVMVKILDSLGVSAVHSGDTLRMGPQEPREASVPYQDAKRLRASSLFLGPLLGRLGEAKVPLPGGCDIGSRPLDLHIKGLQELGADVWVEHGYVVARAERLQGTEIYLDFPSVGATENIMMSACTARGTTLIYNAAKEPEVVDLANFLTLLGARVVGAGTDMVRIYGTGERTLSGGTYSIIPDRIEAGTYLLAGLITGGEVAVNSVIPKHLESVLAKLEEAGASLSVRGDSVEARLKGRAKAVNVKTLPYPGFPTDLQPVLTAFMMLAEGTSIITERIFEDRFRHVDELKRLGGQAKMDSHTAVILGTERLSGAPVTATDLRTGAALVVAGLAAEGETLVDGAVHLMRGYEFVESKLAAIGADIRWDGSASPRL